MWRKVEVLSTVDADGVRVSKVPLARGGYATVLPEDYERILELGFSDKWSLQKTSKHKENSWDYVFTFSADQPAVVVARIIAASKAGDVVSYRDGDHTNLRRDNLVVGQRRRLKNTAALMRGLRAPMADAGGSLPAGN